ncbi:hypothetical protein D9M72_197730 [compost metagenome]
MPVVVVQVIEVASDHHPYDVGRADLVLFPGADVCPVAEDGDPVGKFPDLLHAVRDVDEADSGGAQFVDDREKVEGFGA